MNPRISQVLAVVGSGLALGYLTSTLAFAAPNPQGTGQPGAPNTQCGTGNATATPPGQSTGGFTNATSVYAGSPGTPSQQNANSSKAISQYDVSCYQQTQRQATPTPAPAPHK